MKFYSSRERGFTLLEVLVVVAIIATLSTVAFFSYQDARKSVRDRQRVVDLQQMQLALRLYKDANGQYPPTGCSAPAGVWAGPGPTTDTIHFKECSDYAPGLVPNYIAVLPTDPTSENINDVGYYYRASPDGSQYKLIAYNVVEKGLVKQEEPFARYPLPPCSGNDPDSGDPYGPQYSYAVYSSGAVCW